MSEVLEHAWAAEPHEVQAILAGRQLQFRRPVEGVRLFGEEYDRHWYPHAIPPGRNEVNWSWWEGPPHGPSCYELKPCPWGKPGDRVWVQEESAYEEFFGRTDLGGRVSAGMQRKYKADGLYEAKHWNPATEMPRTMSRLLLEVESMQVARLHNIKDRDALIEGVEIVGGGRYALGAPGLQPQGSVLDAYRTLHAHQYGPERWALNEWYWIVTFRVVEPVDKSAADLSWSRVTEEPDGTQVYGPYN